MPPLAWAALALLALLVLLLAVPVRIEAQVKYDAPSLRLKVLFVSVQLWPPKSGKPAASASARGPFETAGGQSRTGCGRKGRGPGFAAGR